MLTWLKSKTTPSTTRKDYGSFQFHLHSQPQHIDSSSTITLTAYTNILRTATIPCVYRWSVTKNGYTTERPQYKGTSFKCQPADIGAIIQAEVISTDPQYPGTAVVHFGPITMDLSLKRHVQKALSTGIATMNVHVVNGVEERECQVVLEEGRIMVRHVYSEAGVVMACSMYGPYLECGRKESNRLMIRVGEEGQLGEVERFKKQLFGDPIKDLNFSAMRSTSHSQYTNNISPYTITPTNPTANNHLPTSPTTSTLQLKFPSHCCRDIFTFTWQGFTTKKQLRSSLIINKLQRLIDFSENNNTLDYVMEIQGLRRDLVRMDGMLRRVEEENVRWRGEVERMGKEMEGMVGGQNRQNKISGQNRYSVQRSDCISVSRDDCPSSSMIMSSSRKTQRSYDSLINSNTYRHLQHQNHHLNTRLHLLTQQIDTIRFQPLTKPLTQPLTRTPLDPLLPPPISPTQQYKQTPFSKKKTQDDTQCLIDLLEGLTQSRVSCGSDVSSIDGLGEDGGRFEGKGVKGEQKRMVNNNGSVVYFSHHHHSSSSQNNNPNPNHNIKTPLSISSNNHYPQPQLPNIHPSLYQPHSNPITNSQSTQPQLYLPSQHPSHKQLSRSQSHVQLLNNYNNNKKEENDIELSSSVMNCSFRTERKQAVFEEWTGRGSRVVGLGESRVGLKDMEREIIREKGMVIRGNEMVLRESRIITEKEKDNNENKDEVIRRLNEEIMQLKQHNQLLILNQTNHQVNPYHHQQSPPPSSSPSFSLTSPPSSPIQTLKHHNDFLTTQNAKLTKACQRYMNEARECQRLRMELVRLRGVGMGMGCNE